MNTQDKDLDWPTLCKRFAILPASKLAGMTTLEKFQDLDREQPWMGSEDPPAILLFVSHRWEGETHPDETGQQLRSLQVLIDRTAMMVRALFADRDQRLALVPDLGADGILQAEEIARRLLGHGPRPGWPAARDPQRLAKQIGREVAAVDSDTFDRWLSKRIGLWLDYCCVPQAPRDAEEQMVFESTLLNLDKLLDAATVLALRHPGDDYAERAWCVSEIWLGARHSFSRSLFVDMQREADGLKVRIPDPPSVSDPAAAGILREGYDGDRRAFELALTQWQESPIPLEHAPPDAWSAYRSLQGSGTFAVAEDPNPARRGVELERSVAVELIRRWWWSQSAVTVDVGELIDELAERCGLRAKVRIDRIYLALLLSSQGWIQALRPLFRDCLEAFLKDRRQPLCVELEPLSEEIRLALTSVAPQSPESWFSRLASQGGHTEDERFAIESFRRGLEATPLGWRRVSTGDG